ncbi:hypothetical protein FB451DRAFT_1404419 [Mycena latifolia]|nr:hypothetical protein FB451DRAFT_1404419 [Mycena latifolia]
MPILTNIRLHVLLAVSTHGALAGPGQALRLLPLSPNVRAADVVYAPVHAPAGSAPKHSVEVWVPAPPRRTRGCSTRVVHRKRDPHPLISPSPSVRAIPVCRVRVHTHTPPPSSRHPHPTNVHTYRRPLPRALTYVSPSLTLVLFF